MERAMNSKERLDAMAPERDRWQALVNTKTHMNHSTADNF
jgi:hypothetical protein